MTLAFPPPIEALRQLAGAQTADDPGATALRGARLPMLVTAGRERDFRIVFVNQAFTALTGYEAEEVLGRNPRFLQGPETDPVAVAAIRSALDEGRELSVEILNYRKDGSPFWNGMFMSPVRADSGAVAYWFASHLDISPRKTREHDLVRSRDALEIAVEQRTDHLKAAVEQKTVLLHEVEHRVKNNLQLITSLLQYQTRRTEDPIVRSALRQVQDRISAVSTAHRGLFQSEDPGRFDVAQFLRDLVDDLVGRTGRTDIQISFDLEPLGAAAAKAAPLALLVNELLTHALGSNGSTPRSERLAVRLRGGSERCTIEFSDDASVGAQQVRASLGGPAGIVDILSRQLGAAVEWRDDQPGVTARITLPMEPA
jgi:PAS domain S-box-containing protein